MKVRILLVLPGEGVASGRCRSYLCRRFKSSAKRLLAKLLVATMAWVAPPLGLAINHMESHMEASFTLKVHVDVRVQGEAHGGAAGP
jgi:hypothetical protein